MGDEFARARWSRIRKSERGKSVVGQWVVGVGYRGYSLPSTSTGSRLTAAPESGGDRKRFQLFWRKIVELLPWVLHLPLRALLRSYLVAIRIACAERALLASSRGLPVSGFGESPGRAARLERSAMGGCENILGCARKAMATALRTIESTAKTATSAVGSRRDRRTYGHFSHYWNTADRKSAKPCGGKPRSI